MIRFLFALFMLSGLSYSQEYPLTFSNLSTPLFKSIKPMHVFLGVQPLASEIKKFNKEVVVLLKQGFEVDKSHDKKDIKKYLKKLRKLQKHYDYILHLFHEEIQKAINEDDYKLFDKLSNLPLDGLLKNKNLQNKAISFYKKKKRNKKNAFLEKKINNEKLREETIQEFQNEIIKSQYDSNAKHKSTSKVGIVAKRTLNDIEISFYNKNAYDITLKAKSFYKNISPTLKNHDEIVVKAKSNVRYEILKIGNGITSYRYSYSWNMGSKNAIHDDFYIYKLPYSKGTAHIVSQGFNGTKTHKGSSQYSIDFPMPVGTKVCAARDGVVVKTKSDSNKGGYAKEFASSGNYVRILHNDGTFATYYHLKKGGVLVSIGEKVSRGSGIGYSGNTGYSSGPHLHFCVYKAISARATHTLPIKFISKRGVVDNPKVGLKYISQ